MQMGLFGRALRPVMASAFAAMVATAPAQVSAQSLKQVPENAARVVLSYAPLVKAVTPAVVNIFTTKIVESAGPLRSPLFNDPFFKRFFGDNFGQPRQRSETSLGSGVIVREEGIVITNHHVVEDAKEVRVVLRDRREFGAEIILSDARTDLAVLRLDGAQGGLPTVPFGDSDAVAVGDLVLAIGNPFGVGQTVTSGIVSGLARTSVDISDYRSFIQTDAAINPGNSGGALVAMDGTLIGINTAIFTGDGGSHGIGFAVPSNMAKAVLRSALTGAPLVRPWLGFYGRAMDWDMAAAIGMDVPHGVIVEEVRSGGPADEAGLRDGDIVRTLDGLPVEDLQNLRFRAATKGVGAVVTLGIIRDGADKTVRLNLVAPPEDPPRDPVTIRRNSPIAGAEFVNLSPALVEEINLAHHPDGVMALRVARNSPAARIGLRPGDILRSVNDRKITVTADLRRLMEDPPRVWRMVFDRNGERRAIEIR